MHKVALTIGGSDSSGGAGIQADLKSFMVAGVHGTSAITCITSQNTSGVRRIYPLPAGEVGFQIDAILEDFDVGAAKTGMIYTPEIAKIVAEKMKKTRIVVDPVLSSTTGHGLSSDGLVDAIKKYLIPHCYVITPNIGEAERICGRKIEDIDDVMEACVSIHGMGAENVMIKGGHLKGEPSDVLFDGSKFYTFTLPRMNRKAHGSGCTFSAFLTAFLAKGHGLVEAAGIAKAYTWSAIAGGISPGRGVDIVKQRADHIPVADAIIRQMSGDDKKEYEGQMEKARIWLSLQNAVDEVVSFLPPSLVPEVGINFVYAVKNASDTGGVCGIYGRMVKVSGRPFQSGECRFGASKHVASIVLACMKYDGDMRSAMNISYSPGTVEACRAAGLEVASFDRRYEPEGSSTMEWGTDYAIRKTGHVPDIVWDAGGYGKEAMIRVLGRNPDEVVEKVRKIVESLGEK